MSAYIVEPLHINALVSWACAQRKDGVHYYWQQTGRYINVKSAARIASILYAENVRSVNTRYRESEPMHGFAFKPVMRLAARLSLVQVIKSCHCLDYQSCETDDWEDTEACAVLRGIESAAVCCLPGYESAEWGMPDNVKSEK